MLANAPIGFAFFDRKFRFVRVNQFMADMNRSTISRHLAVLYLRFSGTGFDSNASAPLIRCSQPEDRYRTLSLPARLKASREAPVPGW